MNTEEKLKELILEKYGTMLEFSRASGIANSTLASIMNRGIHKASISNIITICKYLEISVDALAMDRIVPLESANRLKEMTDFLKYLRMNIRDFEDCTVDGIKMTANDANTMLDMLDLSIEMIRRTHSRREEAE